MTYERIAALLKERTGIYSESIGAAVIERAVHTRLTVSGAPDTDHYFEHVSTCEIELQELIEAVVVPETWFFRDREAFVALARIVGTRLATPGRAILRALSLPCSTGEEPFSISMALLDAGLAPERFQLDAVDISARAVTYAKQGVYGKNSFRGHSLEFRDRYFEPVGQGYRLSERVRAPVRFRQGNLFDMYSHAAAYDVIFCRNVLIYFDRAAQQRALQILEHLLMPDGILFVGPAEAGLLLEHGLAPARMRLAFAFRKAGAVANQPKARQAMHLHKIENLPAPARVNVSQPSPLALPPARPQTKPPEVTASEHWIDAAQRLADAGNVAAALQHCEQHLSDADPSARAFYLMGLLHDAAGRTQQACEHYRKALYLDPAHHEAMLHLGMLLRGRGDIRGAQVLLDRAQRMNAITGK